MWIELGYAFAEDMPVFPGLPADRFEPHGRISCGSESNTTMLHHFLHNGTHVDAPWHFGDAGKRIDELALDDFLYERPLFIEEPLKKGELFGRRHLEKAGAALGRADILLLCTGYSQRRSEAGIYCEDFPALSEEAARFIRTELPRVKAVAIDTLSVENPLQGPKSDFVVHRTLLDVELYHTRPVLAIEDVNLGRLHGRTAKRILVVPLRWKGLDASPVNPLAEVE